MTRKLDYTQDTKIDVLELDVACVIQAELFIAYAQQAVEAKGLADRLEARADTIKDSLELEVRKDPEAYGLDKGTRGGAPPVDAIKATAATHPKYLKAQKRYLRAKDSAAILQRACDAMEVRRKMIETLVTLQGQAYFAGPTVPRNIREVYLASQKAREDRVNTKGKASARKREEK